MKLGPDAGQFCLNAKKVDFCANISQATFPPKGQPALDAWKIQLAKMADKLSHLGMPFFPGQHALQDVAFQLMSHPQLMSDRLQALIV